MVLLNSARVSPFVLPKFAVPNNVDGFRLSGEGAEAFELSDDGWLYVQRPLDWSRESHYVMKVKCFDSICE